MRVSLFPTCLADRFYAEGVDATARLLQGRGVDVHVPPALTCCGQPAYNSGHWPAARRVALHTLRALSGSDHVILPSGSCTAMLRHGYPRLLAGTGAAAEAADLAGRAWELAHFLVEVLGVRRLGSGLRGRRVAYHHGCHALRELGVRQAPVALLEGAGARVVPWQAAEECCGFGGLFAVSLPHVSAAMADRKLDTLPDADVLTSADGGCLLQLSGRMARRGDGVPVRHLADLLLEAVDGA